MKNIKPQYFAAPIINYDAAANKVNIGPYVKFDRRRNYDYVIADVKQRYLDHDPAWTTGYVIFETYNLKQKLKTWTPINT